MRVVAGELGGRRLEAPRGTEVRPTADRVREALFSILGGVEGAVALDLYCGTGALGIEAVSRGAERAVLVDVDSAPARHNVETLQLDDRCEVVRSEALHYLRRSRGGLDLVFCDPPYRLAARLGPKLNQLIPDRLASGGRVIVECDVRHPLELTLDLRRERRYGDTLIRVYEVAR